MELKDKLNVEVYLIEHGILLPKDDKEYEYYSNAYDRKNGYYDYYQEYDCNDLENIKKEILDYLKNNCQANEYYIITKQGKLKNYNVSIEASLEEIKQELNDCWEQPDYSVESVVYSVYKDDQKVIHEKFVGQ